MIKGNSVSGSQSAGLDVEHSTNVNAANNLLVTNGIGVKITKSSANFIHGNTVDFNRIDGLDDEGDHGDIIQANSLVGNATSGVGNAELFLSNASGGETVEKNSVLQNHSNAIEVFGTSTGVTISGNTVENNGGDGIGLNGTTHSIVTGNTVKSNAVGIHFAGALVAQPSHRERRRQQQDRWHPPRPLELLQHREQERGKLDDGIFDAEDDSIGTGTAGTENNWTGNTEKKDNHGGGLGH